MNNEIAIRHSEQGDIESIKRLYEQTYVYSGTLQLPHPSLDLWQQRLSKLPDNVKSLVAVMDGEVIGQLGLQVFTSMRRRHVGTFGMGVSESYTGQGVGSRLLAEAINLADNWLNIKRLEIETYTDNEAALALYKKFGFDVEGQCDSYAYRNGEYVSVYKMARIRA